MIKISENLNKLIQENFIESDKSFKGGDTVWIEYRDKAGNQRLKTLTGVCLSNSKKGLDNTIVLRTAIGGVGVEYGFHTLSKNIKNIKLVRKNLRKNGRIKRYDLRSKIFR